MHTVIQRLESEKSTEIQKQLDSSQAKMREEHKQEIARNTKATKIMISMQNFVRNMLKDRLEKRE